MVEILGMVESETIFHSEFLKNQAITRVAVETVRRIYEEAASGDGFRMVLLDDLEDVLAEYGEHPFARGYQKSMLRRSDHAGGGSRGA